jgi:hypothetical protein
MIIKLLTSINFSLLAVMICINFYIKNHFIQLSGVNDRIKSKIIEEKQLISTLRAELSYVKSPKYLQQLASKYLTLQSISPAQIAKDFQEAISKSAKKTKK